MIAEKAFETLQMKSPKSPEDGWEPEMPTWIARGHPRGLLGWGETRKGMGKQGDPIKKKGMPHSLCRKPILEALATYFDLVTRPPVVSGS